MGIDVERTDATHVTCEMCLKEVPASEAAVAEATDYVLYFCGLDCYETWKRQSDRNKTQPVAAPDA